MDDERSCWDDEDFLDAVLDFSVKYKGKSLFTGIASCQPPRKKAKQTLPHSKPMTTSLKTLDVIKIKGSQDDDAVDVLYTGSTLRPGPGKAEPLSQFKDTGSLKTLAGNHNQGKSLYTGNASCQPPRKKGKQPLPHSKPMTTSLKTLDGYHKPESSMADDRHNKSWSDIWDDEGFLDAVLDFSEKYKGKSLFTGIASCQPPRKKAKQTLSHSKPMTTSLKTLDGYYKPESSMADDRHNKSWSDIWDDEGFLDAVLDFSEKYKGKALFTGIASCPPPRKAADPLSHSKPMTTSLKTLDGNHKPESSMADDRHKKSWSDVWDQDFLHEVIKVYQGDYQDVIKVKCSLDDDADDGLNTGNTLRPGPGKAEPLSQFKATGSLKTLADNHNQVDMVGREFHMKP